jgi:general secretion pathway protein D
VQRLSDGAAGGGAPGVPGVPGAAGATAVIADSRNNALILRAPNAARMAAMKSTIARLDQPSKLVGPGGGMWVVHLKNADATRLATVVRAAFAAFNTGGAGGAGAAAVGSPGAPAGLAGAAAAAGSGVSAAAQPSTGGFIQADPATNSLVITAPEPLYKQVRALIDELDTRRAQVYIESMIVEVGGSEAVDFGFQWQGLFGQSGDKTGLIAGTNFSTGGPSIISINTDAAQGKVSLGEGLNIGLLRAYNGVVSLAAIARALQSQTDVNIISTPNLMSLDNEEARIVVGENVPFITGQYTNTGGGSSATNPFQTIERKDVGITLRIRPQIGEGGTVRMTIFQEQSSVKADAAVGTTNAGPSTSKRSIEGTVVVDDGAILVLGGLIEDRFITTRSKVPLLGDIPLLGALFRSESRERRRTNMVVFLRPVVLRDAAGSHQFSIDRYDQIRGEQRATQPQPSAVLKINESPVLPPEAKTPAPFVTAAPTGAASAPAAPPTVPSSP